MNSSGWCCSRMGVRRCVCKGWRCGVGSGWGSFRMRWGIRKDVCRRFSGGIWVCLRSYGFGGSGWRWRNVFYVKDLGRGRWGRGWVFRMVAGSAGSSEAYMG
jgi:hypothetical protein